MNRYSIIPSIFGTRSVRVSKKKCIRATCIFNALPLYLICNAYFISIKQYVDVTWEDMGKEYIKRYFDENE